MIPARIFNGEAWQNMRSRSKGVTTVVGAAVVMAIIFTILVPLIILLQNANALYNQEANMRRIRDVERATENLEVLWTYTDATGRHSLIISNIGPVHVKIVRVWSWDVDNQQPTPSTQGTGYCLTGLDIGLAPGSTQTVDVTDCVTGFTGNLTFIVVTERGRLFSTDIIRLSSGVPPSGKYPYTLTISIVNMHNGWGYRIRITPKSGSAVPRSFTYWATASNDNVTMALGVTPGKFMVELLYKTGHGQGNKWKKVPEGWLISPESNPIEVSVPEIRSLIFILEPEKS